MVFRIVTVQMVLDCYSRNYFLKRVWYRRGYIQIFIHLTGISCAALLVASTVHQIEDKNFKMRVTNTYLDSKIHMLKATD